MTPNKTERLSLWAGVLTGPVGAQMFVAICGFSTLTYTFQQMLHSIALIAVGCWMIKSSTDQMMLYLQHTVQD